MKTWSRKCGFTVVAVLLLMSVMLITGCEGTGSNGGYKPPDGMGAVRLNVKSAIGRTILPDEADVLAAITAYELDFVGTAAANANDRTVWRFKADVSGFVNLAPDTYTVTLTAYTDTVSEPTDVSDPTNIFVTVVAEGTASFSVAATNAEDVTVTLLPIISNTATGIFTWTITDNVDGGGGLTAATMEITDLSGTTVGVGGPYDLLGVGSPTPEDDLTGSVTLDTGYYRVVFDLTNSTATTIKWRQILHIYQNITTDFTYPFDDSHFGATTWTITYDFNGATGATNVQESIKDGESITLMVIDKDFYQNHSFKEWHTNSTGTGGTTYTGGELITDNLTLYAIWEDIGSGEIDVTIEDIELKDDVTNDPIIAESDLSPLSITTTDSISILVTTPPGITFTYDWYIDNFGTTTPVSTANPCVIDAGTSPFDTAGRYLLIIECTDAVSGAMFDSRVWVNIDP
jgi:hypothetical protein